MPIRKILPILLILAMLAACTPAPTPTPTLAEPTAAAPVSEAATATPLPTATAVPPTATLAPTSTPEPTQTPEPTATAVLAAEQFNTWCIPKDSAMTARAGEDPSVMPEGARVGELKGDAISLITPALSCTFSVTFNQKAPEGARIELIDTTGVVWLKSDLIVSPQNPNVLYAVLTHSYLTDPPFWSVRYPVRVRLADEREIWTGIVDMNRGWVKTCWDGTLANVHTLYCHKQQDLHPWDAAYTPPPK